jgi:predicted Na+-dependent transporter
MDIKTMAASKRKRQKFWLKRSFIIVLACLAIALVGYGSVWLIFRKVNSDYYHTLQVLQIPQAGRVLVVAPHTDD